MSEDEGIEHETVCTMCGEDGELVECSSCPSSFHLDCHDPPLRHIPRYCITELHVCYSFSWEGYTILNVKIIDCEVLSLTSSHFSTKEQPWASCSHTYNSVTKQYNLVPA